MSNLTIDALREARVRVDAIMRPWAAFIGAVELRPSTYVNGDAIYALDPSKTNATFTIGEPLPQSVVLHPDTVPVARKALADAERRDISDAELAAYLFWAIRTQPR
jgi:hypothetical protein